MIEAGRAVFKIDNKCPDGETTADIKMEKVTRAS